MCVEDIVEFDHLKFSKFVFCSSLKMHNLTKYFTYILAKSTLIIWGLAYFYPSVAHLLLERERQRGTKRDKIGEHETKRDKKEQIEKNRDFLS